MLIRVGLFLVVAALAFGQNGPPSGGFKERAVPSAGTEPVYRVDPGTHILLSMINGVSTKQAQVGDRIYLETAFPVVVQGKIVVPQGSWVNGTVTAVQKPGRMKQRGELQVRFDTLTLANGATRNFHSDLGAIDQATEQTLDREHSSVEGKSDTGKRAATVATVAGTGAAIGATAGSIGGSALKGAGIGGAAGAAAGLIGTMFAHRPDAVLPKGTTVEMVLDRPLVFTDDDLGRGR